MNTTSKVVGSVLLALVAALAQAGRAPAPATTRVATDPGPLPPHRSGSSARVAINPQPLPPGGHDVAIQHASSNRRS